MAMRYKVGQRVSRPVDVYAKKKKLKFGTVIRAYSERGSRFGDYPELYAVHWDDGSEGRAYLRHGIDAC